MTTKNKAASTILATDLDGTFLGGSQGERDSLYRWIATHRDDITLIFVSGRDLPFVQSLCNSLPIRPDHVIGNVGTTVACGPDLKPHPELEAWLDACWPSGACTQVDAVLDTFTDLTPQPAVEGRRVSRYYNDAAQAETAAAAVRTLGFDALCSDNRFFDVLPRGVHKGATLLRTLAALGLPAERTLVAGDTLNDLSMFDTGFAGVAVGNGEPALLTAVRDMPNVHCSPYPGAAGVLDALLAFHEGRTPYG
ncbi:MAG TPA: HAD family hydrolase [Acidiferrobacter sp.]|nr:HAD family hydrolase [Acidiferrobacter sp.]